MSGRQCTIQDLVNEGILHKPIDGNHGNIHPKSTDFVDDGIPFVMASDMQNGMVDLERANKISALQASKLQKGFSYAGDILLSHKGSIGLVAKVPELETDYIMLTPQVTYYRVKDIHRLDADYIKYYFLTDKFQWTMKNLSGGGTRAYIGISAQRELPFILPEIETQKTIVRILSTWDEHLEKLDQKIETKKQIKKGLMQQLLIGKTRPPGFSREWQTKELGDILSKLTDYTANGSFAGLKENVTYYSHPEYSVLVRTTDLEKSVFAPQRFTDKRGHDYLKKTSLYGGELIMANVGNIGKVYRVPKYDQAMTLAPNTYLIEFDNKLIDQEFIHQKMLTQSFKNDVLRMVGSGGLVAINKANFRSINIFVPSDKAEQSAIAGILIAADNEIKSLQDKRNVVIEQRKFLRNNLINGKIQVPENLTKELVHA